MPKISIITTTYKHENFIKYTIESILSQTFTDWELLIGDDSPDNLTRNIIQTYVEKYPEKIKAWHHSPNLGIVDNMNFLLEKVNPKSEYIAFLEGDDMFTPDNLEEKVKVIKQYPNIIGVFSHYKTLLGQRYIPQKSYFSSGLHRYSLLKWLKIGKNPIQSFGCALLKKETIIKKGFSNPDTTDKNFGPLDFYAWLQILPDESFYYIRKALFIHRKHESNLSQDILKMTHQSTLLYQDLLTHNHDKKIQDILQSHIFKYQALHTFATGNLKASRNLLKNSIKLYPHTFMIHRVGLYILSFFPKKFALKVFNNFVS